MILLFLDNTVSFHAVNRGSKFSKFGLILESAFLETKTITFQNQFSRR